MAQQCSSEMLLLSVIIFNSFTSQVFFKKQLIHCKDLILHKRWTHYKRYKRVIRCSDMCKVFFFLRSLLILRTLLVGFPFILLIMTTQSLIYTSTDGAHRCNFCKSQPLDDKFAFSLQTPIFSKFIDVSQQL